jgi:LysM repeat protein
MKKKIIILLSTSLFFISCSPMKSSPKEEKHQMELTLHEVQTNLDDLRHDLNCFNTEMQIIDGKIKHQEDAVQNLKQQHLEKIQNKLDLLSKQVANIETKSGSFETKCNSSNSDISQLSTHANETILALTQHKQKINELENLLFTQNQKISEIAKIKTTLEDIVKTMKTDNSNYVIYKVKAKDSLEKIAKVNNVSVETLKKLNNLENDLIVVGQDIKIPK